MNQTRKLSDNELNVVKSNTNLDHYLESLTTGRNATPRSWLYDGHKSKAMEPDAILDEWLSRLQTLQDGSEPEKEVYQFDTAQVSKWGPQGKVPPIEELMDIVLEGYQHADEPTPAAFSSAEWTEAKLRVQRRLTALTGAHSLRPASYMHVIDDMRARDTLESNSGWPLFTGRKQPEVINASVADALSGRWKTYPAIALFRNYNQKTRLVWMFPMSANLVEGSFFQPLQSALIDKSTQLQWNQFSPWLGFDVVRRQVSYAYSYPECILGQKARARRQLPRINVTVEKANDNGSSINEANVRIQTKSSSFLGLAASDFSSTDAHFTVAHTLEVFDVIKFCFQKQYWEQLKESMVHLHSIPLVIGQYDKIEGMHGVSSGSNWTNFVETIFDIILGEYVNICEADGDERDATMLAGLLPPMQINPDFNCFYAIGDDMSWICRGYDSDFATRLEEYGKAVGMVIKAEKTTNDPGKVKSLQRLFIRGYSNPATHEIRAIYPTVRALKSLVYPEKFHRPKDWSKDMFAARTFMILENCVDHPLFEEFVRFVCDGHSYLREFAQKCVSNPAYAKRTTGKTKLLPGLNPSYNAEKRDSSLDKFASIHLAARI